MSDTVRNDLDRQRYEIDDGDGLGAFVEYRSQGAVADFLHTETLAGHEGRGLGSRLVRGALDDARGRGWQVRPSCPFVRVYIARHRDYLDLVPEDERERFGLDAPAGPR